MKKNFFYGMKRKISFLLVGIWLLAFVITSGAVCLLTAGMVDESITEKYSYMNEKAVLRLSNAYVESDNLTEQYITNEMVQKSLERAKLSKSEAVSLRKQLSCVNLPNIKYVFYIDNKNQVYGAISEKFNVLDFKKSDLYGELQNYYSVTRWIWGEDITRQGGEETLYVCRMIRHMKYAHEPGVIMIGMDQTVFEDILSEDEIKPGITRLIFSDRGEVCYQRSGKEDIYREQELFPLLTKEKGEEKIKGGHVLYQREEHTGFLVVTVLSDRVYSSMLKEAFLPVFCIFLCIGVVVISIGIFFSRRLTEPINEMNGVMEQFDGSSFNGLIHFNTNTELDSMSEAYNRMLIRMESMVREMTSREREAYRLQLDSLMHQINPHFLYNILDNIYMMARLSGDERMMDILQALSNFLRIGLSKGKEEITVEKELSHVQSYLDIQKIRNQALFDYEIICPEELKKCSTLKLILQPLAENCIQHGFVEMNEGGYIRIIVEQQEESILFRIWNNGSQIEEPVLCQLNAMERESFETLEACFEDKKGGYGVVNVVKRLRLYYGTAMGFHYVSKGGGTLCTVKIPVRET